MTKVDCAIVKDMNGVEIVPGQRVIVHQDEGDRMAIVAKAFPDSPAVNEPGHWVDVSGDDGLLEGIPSYLLEVVVDKPKLTVDCARIAELEAESKSWRCNYKAQLAGREDYIEEIKRLHDMARRALKAGLKWKREATQLRVLADVDEYTGEARMRLLNEQMSETDRLKAENARLREVAEAGYEALTGLLDGLDANTDERCGLTQKQWDNRVSNAHQAIEEWEESHGDR